MNDEEISGADAPGAGAERPDAPEKTRKRKAKSAPKKKKAAKKVLDPLGDTSDGEGQFATGAEVEEGPASEVAEERAPARADAAVAQSVVGAEAEKAEPEPKATGNEIEEEVEARPAPRLERLQKILAQAGVASRRHAEELITQGRVQVNGEVVTLLGSKADPERDHIRVDGKLLHGAERLRYFVLNKPRGYVTTVSDPEGRPTVMEFFAKLGERLYPVGRLDFQSEGLLLVTNDGTLANQLTRAASGVEKTYLVKVSGTPDDARLQGLREGVAIERGRPGEGKVRTAPARIRQIRPGDNPWYEVVLIEGRNRELRKMFEEIGHHVEKIRRVGYGPLTLDVPPGKMRELDRREVEALRQTADGKLKPRRVNAAYMLPKEAGIPAEQRAKAKARDKGAFRKQHFEQKDRPPQRREFGDSREGGLANRGERAGGFRRASDEGRQAPRREFGGTRGSGFPRRGAEGFRSDRGQGRPHTQRDDRGGPARARDVRGEREDRATPREGQRPGGFAKREWRAGGFRSEPGKGRPDRFGGENAGPGQRREGRTGRSTAERGPGSGRKPLFRGRSERPGEGRARIEGRDQRGGGPRPGRDSGPELRGGARREGKRFEGGRGPRGGGYGAKGGTGSGQRSRPYGGKRTGGKSPGKGRKRF